ncbi:MAG: extracellular solute-binding protein [Thermomicrobiales bacterium]
MSSTVDAKHLDRLPLSRRRLMQAGAGLAASAAMLAAMHIEQAAAAQEATPIAPITPREGDVVEFSYLRPTWGPATFTKDGPFQQMLQEQGKAKIEVQIIPVIDFDTKINTVLASGEIPDVIWGSGPGRQIWKDAQDQGAFAPINEYLDKYQAVREAVPESFWEMLKDDDGNIYFIPNLIYPIVPFFIFYRQDIFEAKGIAEPTSIDEFVAALEQLKGDPNVSPLTMGYTWHAKDIGTSFDLSLNAWMPAPDNADHIDPWFVQQPQIDLHFWFQDLHKRLLLDQNYGINPEPNLSDDRFQGGKSVVALANWAKFPEFVTNLRKVDSNAKVGVISPMGETGGTRSVFPIDRGFYISAKMKNIDGFFDFLNWSLTGGTTLRRYGIEGKMFNVVDGAPQPIPNVDRDPAYQTSQVEPLSFLAPMSEKLDWAANKLSYESAGVGDQFEYIKGKFEEYSGVQYPDWRNPLIISPTDGKDGTTLYEDNLRPVIDSVIINHDRTKDDWAAALQKWRDQGGDKIIEEVNELQTDKSKPDYGV